MIFIAPPDAPDAGTGSPPAPKRLDPSRGLRNLLGSLTDRNANEEEVA
jgi:hypothetical protein